MGLPRPCVNHPRVFAIPGKSHCRPCLQRLTRDKAGRRGDNRSGARAQMRRFINRRGWAVCCHPDCPPDRIPAADVEVDHIIPVTEGGSDTDQSNVQALCLRHHHDKHKAKPSPTPLGRVWH